MSSSNKRNTDRFSVPSPHSPLPELRRPSYKSILQLEVDEPVDVRRVFKKWSLEDDEKYYSKINSALLSDNYHVLKKYESNINDLRQAIKQNLHRETVKVYRNLKLDSKYVRQEYKIGKMFLWPTFSNTSRDKDIASEFGNYTFQINISTEDSYTYRADISEYSTYSYEQEILIYPYSGFCVTNIIPDAKIIQLDCVDTLDIENYCRQLIPEEVKLFDKNRQIYVYLYKNKEILHFSHANNRNKRYVIKQNQTGYWDSHHRYYHKNGYFIYNGNQRWKECHANRFHASFKQI